jgi:hypothetical protein
MATRNPTTETFKHRRQNRAMLLGILFMTFAGCTRVEEANYKTGESYQWEGILFSPPILVEIAPGMPVSSSARANALFTSNGNDYRLYFTPATKFSRFDEGRSKNNAVWRVKGEFQEQRKILVDSMKYVGDMSKVDSALYDALIMNRLSESRDRINNGGDPNLAITERMLSSLCGRAARGESESNEVIRAAVKAGANVNAKNVDEVTPISVVVRDCFDHTLVKQLVDAGAESNVVGPGDRSLLGDALSRWNFLQSEAKKADASEETKRRARDQILVVDALLQGGAHLTAQEQSCIEPTDISTYCRPKRSFDSFEASRATK